MIRIVIADDHAIVRQGLKQILEENADMRVVAEAVNGSEVLPLLRSNKCSVLLLDISMPEMSGIAVLKRVREEMPALPVLILSIYAEDQYAVRLVRSGAAGYMTKESAPAEVVEAVRRVAKGGTYISVAVARMLCDDSTASPVQSPDQLLSGREYQIFLLLSAALTVSEVARDLQLSVNTVSTYRKRILEKLNLQNNAELMRYAVREHLA
jgi:DNA-binding NarL/FixJ family response regulator